VTSGIEPSGWTQVGQSPTSPVDNKKRAEVTLDSYYLVVGFEVNFPKAFVNDVHDLHVDYGHAFFYLVKNSKIERSFSFGPTRTGKIGWFDKGERPGFGHNVYNVGAVIKDGRRDSRPATPDYSIDERVKAFQIRLSLAQARTLEAITDKYRRRVLSEELRYNAIWNDTCAEKAKEILDSAGISTPSGRGLVKYSGVIDFSIISAVNPYKWHKAFQSKYKEMSYPNPSGSWVPQPGDDDPIFGVPAAGRKDQPTVAAS
jgi:hypothetical protein